MQAQQFLTKNRLPDKEPIKAASFETETVKPYVNTFLDESVDLDDVEEAGSQWAILAGAQPDNMKTIVQAVIGLRAVVQATAFDIEMAIITNFYKLVLANWPDNIPMRGRFYEFEGWVTMRLMRKFYADKLVPNYEFKFVKEIRGALVWASRRSKFDNINKLLNCIWKMREELGPIMGAYIDDLAIILDQLMYCKTFYFNPPTGKYIVKTKKQ